MEAGERAARRQSRRSQRIRTACLRCQQRKTRVNTIPPTFHHPCADHFGSAMGHCRFVHHVADQTKSASIRTAMALRTKHERRSNYRNVFTQLSSTLGDTHNILSNAFVGSRISCPDVDLTNETGIENADNVNDASSSTFHAASALVPDNHHELSMETEVPDVVHDASMITNERAASDSEAPINDSQHADSSLTHQIGLVSLPNGDDPRYIGPSSGHFFTQLVCTASASTKATNLTRINLGNATLQRDSALTEKLLRNIQTPLPSSRDLTQELTLTYFRTIHQHLPFLHEPTHMSLIEEMYASDEPDPVVAFQVYMVLAISSIMLSRRDRVVLPSEGWAAMALLFFEKKPLESSIRGLQCLLLLHVWGMHSPATKLNIWYLNYQCIAMVVDLGLQRDVTSAMSISPFDQEMRTRLFWVVYSLDRSLCTMMGRPIGLRDEACDLRLPADIDDMSLQQANVGSRTQEQPPSHMSYAIHLFKLARLNSEMKYILHSISRDTPAYAYPAVRCMKTWQAEMVNRLDQWAADIPQGSSHKDYVVKLCRIRHHVLKTLLLRPSPGIPKPSSSDLQACYASAIAAIKLYHELYVENSLVFSWASYHSIMMSAVTAFFCIWTCPSVAQGAIIDELVSDLRAASNILSATGEHWPGAKRSRDILDELSHRTITWLMDRKSRNNHAHVDLNGVPNPDGESGNESFHQNQSDTDLAAGQTQAHELEALMQQYSRNWTPGLDFLPSSFDQMSDPNTGLWTGDMNTDTFLQDLFDGLAPMSF
ncbi:hypothetical protein E4T48_01314 [Aureobasidium sp. EXF-10727]|nr:hypothetical protein E4T48_01314 [Aureobasidium sp. EXF-10727]